MRFANGAIEVDPGKLSGALIFSGTRVPVQNLFDYLEGGETIEEFLTGFPPVSREQVTLVLDFFGLTPAEIARPNPDDLIGRTIELRYSDQNTAFEAVFPTQECTVVRRLLCVDGTNYWYLVRLTRSFSYGDAEYNHLLLRSRHVGCHLGKVETAVSIVLVPDAERLTNPFVFDPSLYVAWGMASPASEQYR